MPVAILQDSTAACNPQGNFPTICLPLAIPSDRVGRHLITNGWVWVTTAGCKVRGLRRCHTIALMEANNLRPCPFCSNENLTVVYADGGRTVTVKCNECGACGPQATNSDPPGHAEFQWNLRYGVGIEH
jgi:hypothetical protein